MDISFNRNSVSDRSGSTSQRRMSTSIGAQRRRSILPTVLPKITDDTSEADAEENSQKQDAAMYSQVTVAKVALPRAAGEASSADAGTSTLHCGITLSSHDLSAALRQVILAESQSFQVKLTPATLRLTEGPTFCSLVECFMWLGIVELKRRFYPAQFAPAPSTASGVAAAALSLEKKIFHRISQLYGVLFESVQLRHNDNPAAFLEHQDACIGPIPTLVPKAAYYLLTASFPALEDERRFDAKLRFYLAHRSHFWLTGVVPQRINLRGWKRHQFVRAKKKAKLVFSTQGLSQMLDRIEAANGRSTDGRELDSLRMRESHSKAGPRPMEPSTARGPARLTPTHVGNDRWYEHGRYLSGHVTSERIKDAGYSRVEKSVKQFSPAMQHYFETLHLEAQQSIAGGGAMMKWSTLSKMDRRGDRMIFSRSSKKPLREANRLLWEDRQVMETMVDDGRREVVQNHRSNRFWEGKAKAVEQSLVKIYSKRSDDLKAIREDLIAKLQLALQESHQDPLENIQRYAEALQLSAQHVFDIPLPHRTKIHELTTKCYGKLKTLQRTLPTLAEMEHEQSRFGETISFTPATLKVLDELVATIDLAEDAGTGTLPHPRPPPATARAGYGRQQSSQPGKKSIDEDAVEGLLQSVASNSPELSGAEMWFRRPSKEDFEAISGPVVEDWATMEEEEEVRPAQTQWMQDSPTESDFGRTFMTQAPHQGTSVSVPNSVPPSPNPRRSGLDIPRFSLAFESGERQPLTSIIGASGGGLSPSNTPSHQGCGSAPFPPSTSSVSPRHTVGWGSVSPRPVTQGRNAFDLNRARPLEQFLPSLSKS
jgi:hypothetical protein